MCGIAGTIYSSNYITGIDVKPDDLFTLLRKIQKGNGKCSELLDLAWKYKSNINFLRYCNSSSEQSKIALLCEHILKYSKERKSKLPLIDKSITLDLYKQSVSEWQNLVDAHWFFSEELGKTKDLIETLSNTSVSELEDSTIILFRDITKVIHAIDNRLELRGRDSFGLSICMTSPHFNIGNINDHVVEDKKESIYYTKGDKVGTYSFVFKACNSIGGLGDNAIEIKRLISSNAFFIQLIKSGQVTSATIMAHTRWASVGKVNYENTHPVALIDSGFGDTACHTLSCLNGDIYNYKEVISRIKKTHVLSTDESVCTSDVLCVPAYLLGETDISVERISQMANHFTGSFAIAIQHSSVPEKLFLVKKGIQGLYLGFSYDGVLFASDVYGLVETCKYFLPIDSNVTFELSSNNLVNALEPKVNIHNLQTNSLSAIKTHQLQVTNITTRDIDKRGYKHFLEKEIYETRDIVERTLNAYLQPELRIVKDSLALAINITENQIPKFIVDRLKCREIKKVVITGMGTCYTAAVAISMYMRFALKYFISDILVEPHVASEGSAFYIKPDMRDTLVIVIAQTGTTVDTNVYVQMAKERGACSLAIANKREGDVTFIVDGTLYIGEGRDIEVAVPSTKTYTAQVVLGYIVSLYFACNLAESASEKNRIKEELKKLLNLVKLIDDSFAAIEKNSNFRQITKEALKYNSWYVLRDGSSNSVCADEIRIKYSENCYQSVTSITVSEALRLGINESFLMLISEEKLSVLATTIITLIAQRNILVLISIDGGSSKELQELIDSDLLYIVEMPPADKYYSFIPTILAGQFISYFQAIELDKRIQYFSNLKNSLDDKDRLLEAVHQFGIALKAGYFNQGYSVSDLSHLHDNLEKYIVTGGLDKDIRGEIKNSTTRLELLSRRTIDTIKHQAKTITVGAVRESSDDQDQFYGSKLLVGEMGVSSEERLVSFDDVEKELFISFPAHQEFDLVGNREVLLAFEGLDESVAYNIINHVSEYGRQLSTSLKIRLAQPYDHQKQGNRDNEYWIILTDCSLDKEYSHLRGDQFTICNFELWKPSDYIISNFCLSKNLTTDYAKSVWSFLLGLLLSRKLVLGNRSNLNKTKSLIKKFDIDALREINMLVVALEHLDQSEGIGNQISYASKLFLSRKNWKCIGSGANYNFAKNSAKKLIKELRRACAFDVLENHKHIDMSAEAAIFVFIAGIWKHGYQEDAISEIKKILAHNSLPIIVTDSSDHRFDAYSIDIENSSGEIKQMTVPIIKLPRVALQYAYPLNVLLLTKITAAMKIILNFDGTSLPQKIAVVTSNPELANANLWK